MVDQQAFEWLDEYTLAMAGKEQVPDARFATDNDWDVPVLDLALCADVIDMPILTWGANVSRAMVQHGSTVHFYTEDYRFEALWDNPAPLVNMGAITAVEPNWSVYDDTPRALAIWNTYRKRWMARWWQTRGVRIVVDLNVSVRHASVNLLGVPLGWHSFATRGYHERIDALEAEYEIARRYAGQRTPNFLVYGGGRRVKEVCQARAWLWVAEMRDRWKGKWSDG